MRDLWLCPLSPGIEIFCCLKSRSTNDLILPKAVLCSGDVQHHIHRFVKKQLVRPCHQLCPRSHFLKLLQTALCAINLKTQLTGCPTSLPSHTRPGHSPTGPPAHPGWTLCDRPGDTEMESPDLSSALTAELKLLIWFGSGCCLLPVLHPCFSMLH